MLVKLWGTRAPLMLHAIVGYGVAVLLCLYLASIVHLLFLLKAWSGISVPAPSAPVLGFPSQVFHMHMARFMSNFTLLFGCGASAVLSDCSLCAQLTFILHHEIARMWLLLYPVCVCRRGILTRSPA